jgi:hypothetical protein
LLFAFRPIEGPVSKRNDQGAEHVIANLPVDNDRPRLIDVLTQLLPFIRYPQRAEDYRRSRPTSGETGITAKLQGRVVERRFRELVGEVGESDFESERPPGIDFEVGENSA